MIEEKSEFKIGNIVRFNEADLQGTGEILGLAYDYPLCKGWIVGIITRDTEFLQNRPEKAWIVIESQMKIIEKK